MRGERKAGYVSTHLFRSAAEGTQLGRKKNALWCPRLSYCSMERGCRWL